MDSPMYSKVLTSEKYSQDTVISMCFNWQLAKTAHVTKLAVYPGQGWQHCWAEVSPEGINSHVIMIKVSLQLKGHQFGE